MKRRRSKPLLRASMAVVGTAMLACAGPGDGAAPDPPPAPEPVELAESRELKIVVAMPENAPAYKSTAMIFLTTVDGQEISQRSVQVHNKADGLYTSKWTIDHRKELPKRVKLSILVPADDNKANPSRGDLFAEVIGLVGEELRLEPTRYMPVVKAVVHTHSTKEPDSARPPVYANTKGSHHYQPPPPVSIVQIDLEGPNDPALRTVTLRFVTDVPEADELRVEVEVPRLPAEIHVTAPSGQYVPERFQVFIDAAQGTDDHRAAQMDSMQGDTVRAVLRKP